MKNSSQIIFKPDIVLKSTINVSEATELQQLYCHRGNIFLTFTVTIFDCIENSKLNMNWGKCQNGFRRNTHGQTTKNQISFSVPSYSHFKILDIFWRITHFAHIYIYENLKLVFFNSQQSETSTKLTPHPHRWPSDKSNTVLFFEKSVKLTGVALCWRPQDFSNCRKRWWLPSPAGWSRLHRAMERQ